MIRKKVVLRATIRILGLIVFNWLVLMVVIISLKWFIDYFYSINLNIIIKQVTILIFSLALIVLWLFLWRYSIKIFKLRVLTKHGAEETKSE